MKRILPTITFIFLSVSSFPQNSAKLEEVMDVYTKQYKFSGSALIIHNGVVLLNKGYGYRDAAKKIPNDANTIFQLGSITKQFTSTVILKLQEEKKLNVKDKLSKYFPTYPKADSITIENLLTHTSGIYSYTSDEKFMNEEVDKPANREKMMALFKDKPLEFSPGTKWNYSNSAYSLLGYIIEDVSKMPYEQAVRKYIFNKTGMKHSGFDFTHLSDPNKATGYLSIDPNTAKPSRIVDSSVSYSAGAIYSTTGDLVKWFTAMQKNNIISASSKAKAFTPFMNNYGYGWTVDTIAGEKTIGHSGGIFGFTTNMVSVFDDTTTVILLSNMNSPHLRNMTQNIYSILYNKPYELPKERVAITLPDEIMKQYAGIYELRPDLIVHVKFEDGKLIGEPEGQGPLQLHPEKKDFFFLKEVDAQIKFNRNEKDEVISITLYQAGRELTGKKR